MKIYINPIMNLGDFLNSMPVLAGISQAHGAIELLLLKSMRKFKGLREFLLFQNIFASVFFDDECDSHGYLILNSLTREDKNNEIRPIETCRYENYFKDHYQLNFEVDDEFVLNYPECGVEVKSGFYIGDRWTKSAETDNRRKTDVLKHLSNYNFIDFDNDMLTNTYIIAKSEKPFISTFTGVSNIADLLRKEHFVVWEDSMTNWDNKPIEYSFEKHYYKNRFGKLMYIRDFEKFLGINT